jgi:5-enolpyruvylshikimate-3-phosphate synthase
VALGGGVIDSHGDHRIAMPFMAAPRDGAIEILDCTNVNTSFPGFVNWPRCRVADRTGPVLSMITVPQRN